VLQAQGSLRIENAVRFVSGITSEDLSAGAHVRNISNTDRRVKVRSEVISIPEGGQTYFCWKECYTPAITDAPEYIEIPAGESVSNFYGYYRPNDINGEAKVRFIFYNTNEPGDSVHLEISFAANAAAIAPAKEIKLEAYPNPASNEVMISFVKPGGQDAWLDLFNMLGNKIQSVKISGTDGTARIETSSLKSGIYFYALRGSGKPQRITIKH